MAKQAWEPSAVARQGILSYIGLGKVILGAMGASTRGQVGQGAQRMRGGGRYSNMYFRGRRIIPDQYLFSIFYRFSITVCHFFPNSHNLFVLLSYTCIQLKQLYTLCFNYILHLHTLIYTCIHLYTLLYTCIHMFSISNTYIHLFARAHT